MIVTGHQLNLLPGVSVVEKIRAADICVVMDLMQYERHGFVNRNRFEDGQWFTVPVAESDTFRPIRDVTIADPTGRAREKVARTLEHRLGPAGGPYAEILRRPYRTLAALNWTLLARLLSDLNVATELVLQSHLAAGVYEDVSDGIAAMTTEVGGTTWLSGRSGRDYLAVGPFEARGITVQFFDTEGPNPTAAALLSAPRPAPVFEDFS